MDEVFFFHFVQQQSLDFHLITACCTVEMLLYVLFCFVLLYDFLVK